MLPKTTRPGAGRYMAVVVCAGLLFSYWSAHSLLVHGQAGGGALANENGDLNGDGRRDLADAVHYLSWLFEGGPPPVACAANEDVEFGRRIAGTYYGPGESDNGPFVDMITINADGTYTGINTNGDPADGFGSPEHGVWERVGEREVASTSLIFSYDESGAQNFTFRIRATGSFSEDFQIDNVSFRTDVFLPDQDPLSDEPVQTSSGTGVFRRIGVIR